MISARSPYDISAKSPGATRTKGDKPLWELALGQVLQTFAMQDIFDENQTLSNFVN